MKNTYLAIVAGVVMGLLGGVAVGYWEARPWAAGGPFIATSVNESGHNHEHEGEPTAANGATEAQVVAPETEFHFGRMESGAKQRHTFPLRNTGASALTVTYVSHTCKCTEVRWNDKPVEPGEVFQVPPGSEASIMLEWAAKAPPGPFRHGATFTTTDPVLKRLEITVEGQIVDSTTLEPSHLNFGSVHVGKPGKAEFLVLAHMEPKVEILSHEVIDEALAQHVQIAIEPVSAEELVGHEAKAGVKVIATYEPGDTLGPFAGSLKLETNLKKAPSLEVPIIGTVKGDISIFGNFWNETAGVVRLPPVTSKQGGSWKFDVTIRGEHAAGTEVTVASVNPPELKVSLGERKQIRDGLVKVPLTIELAPGTRPMVREGEDQGGHGEIVLATTHPDTTKVQMRVNFVVQP